MLRCGGNFPDRNDEKRLEAGLVAGTAGSGWLILMVRRGLGVYGPMLKHRVGYAVHGDAASRVSTNEHD
jgi:hypothetical protein